MKAFYEHLISFAILIAMNILNCMSGEIWAMFLVKVL